MQTQTITIISARSGNDRLKQFNSYQTVLTDSYTFSMVRPACFYGLASMFLTECQHIAHNTKSFTQRNKEYDAKQPGASMTIILCGLILVEHWLYFRFLEPCTMIIVHVMQMSELAPSVP